MKLSETKIKEIIDLFITENNEQAIREHNYLVSLVRSYNLLPSNQTNKRRELFKQIQNKSKILKYSLSNDGNNIVVVNNAKPIKTIAIRQSQDEINDHKILSEYSNDFQEFIRTLFNTGGLIVHKLDIGSDPEQAQRNIVQGKKTVTANQALDSLYNMFINGYIKIKATKYSQSLKIPIDEYFKMFEDDKFSDDEDYNYAFMQMMGENKINEGRDEIKEINQLATDVIDYLTTKNMRFFKDFVSGLGRSSVNFNVAEFSLDHDVTNINKYVFLKNFLKEFPVKIVIVKSLNGAGGVWVSYGNNNGGEIDLKLREDDFIKELEWFANEYNLQINWNNENAYAGLRYALNDEFKSILVHELQHAFDDFRSGGKYTSDKKSVNYYKDLDYNPFNLTTNRTNSQKEAYYGLPHEYWARFSSYITRNFINFDRPFKEMSDDFKMWFQEYDKISEDGKKRLQKALYKYWEEENKIKENKNIMRLKGEDLKYLIEKIDYKTRLESMALRKKDPEFMANKYNEWNNQGDVNSGYKKPTEASVLEFFQNNYEDYSKDDEFKNAVLKYLLKNNKSNIKKENIMKLNKQGLTEAVEKVVRALLKEEYDNNWNDLVHIRDNAKKVEDTNIANHASILLQQLNTAGGKELMKSEIESFINDNKKYLNDQINTDSSGNKIGTKVAKDNMIAHITDINSDGTVDLYIDTVNGKPSDEWYDGEYDMVLGGRIIGEDGWELMESVIDESTYSFKADDPELQQKTQKLQNDSTLFNKDEDEIKIDPVNESVYTGGQILEMMAEKKAIRDKNGDYVKAVKKADRETEYDETGAGWSAKQKIHKNDKKYDRKSFKKSEIIEMFKNGKL